MVLTGLIIAVVLTALMVPGVPGIQRKLPAPMPAAGPDRAVHARNASRRYGHAGKHYPGQWRHVEEAARLPDAHARRSTGSARTTSALAMTQRSRRTAAMRA
jgi:hypothetical protein